MRLGTHLPRSVRFGNFELDTRAGELRAENQRLRLQEQPLQILMMLIERAGDVVTREELHTTLWPGSTFGDLEDSLNHAVRRLREALGDTAEEPRFIETVPRRGYRFIAPVEPVAPVSPPAASAAGTRPLQKWRLVALASAAVLGSLAILFAFNVAGLRDWLLPHPTRPKIESIAVLPLANLSGDPEQEYFADGMTEELITCLGKVSALRVISRTSVMQYKGTKKPLPEIARELNVDAVVEGTVLRSGNRVRVTANLLHASTDRHLWAETYERDLRDVLVLQDEVTRAIVSEIRIKLTPEDRTRLTAARPVNPDAHEAYLKGRYYWNLRTEEGLNKGIQYFQRAIENDPGYALPYAGLADAYFSLADYGLMAPREACARSRAAALKALDMDETLAEAHVSLGVVLSGEWDWTGEEREYKRAMELNPSYAFAHMRYAEHLSAMGRHSEAIAEIKRAQELDPLSLVVNTAEGQVFFFARRYDEAIAQCRRTLELNPGFYPAHIYLCRAYEQEKLYDEAISECQKTIALEPGNPAWAVSLARAYAAAGKRTEALKIISHLRELPKQRYVSSYAIAYIYIALGDSDQAMAWLEKAYEEDSPGLGFLKVDPRLDALRSDPRFQNLLRRMNFPP